MNTTSRELVHKTLTFDSPARIPRQLWTLPWASLHYGEALAEIQDTFPDDIVTCPAFCQETPQTQGDLYAIGTYTDEWGCTFQNIQTGVIGEVKEPLVGTWADVERVRIPYEYLSFEVDAVNTFCRQTDKFVLAGLEHGSLPRPFEKLQFIRGSANLFMDLLDQPGELFDLLTNIHQFYIDLLTRWATTEVDALFIMDDWGAQRALLISPELWRQIFKPLYKDYIEIAHQHGKFAFMHSDGYILDILPDLIELGLDAINSQIFCMGIENLQSFRGQITFWGEIDRQHILPAEDPEVVVTAVKQVKETLYQNGGIIAQCEFGAGAKPENVYTVFKTWEEL